MSKHHSASVWRDIKIMSSEELEQHYGVTVDEDSRVWDSFDNKEFDSLEDWASYVESQEDDDNYGNFKTFSKKQRFDDV